MNLTRKWFLIMCVFAFGSVMLLINTNSYHADKNNLNTAYLIAGIALGLVALYSLTKVIKYGGSPKN